jgi:NAD+ diphosphatase
MTTSNPNTRVFRFCPRCGTQSLSPFDIHAFGCSKCGFVFYLNTAAAVAGLIIRKSKELLVVLRNQEPCKGAWDLPGGFCMPGETAEAGLRREIHEELGLEIVSARYFCSAPNHYAFQDTLYETIDMAYFCEVDQLEAVRTSHEIAGFEFVPFAELKADRFGLSSIQAIVTKFIQLSGSER